MTLRNATSVTLVGFSLMLGCTSHTPQFPEGKPKESAAVPPEKDPLEGSLRKAVNELLEALRSGRSDSFLDMCARGGMSIDVDGVQSYAEIQKDFRSRKGWYCHYFDTPCLQKDVRKFWRKIGRKIDSNSMLPVSYRELINTVSGLEVTHTQIIHLENGDVAGSITVKWKSPPPEKLGRGNYLDLTFVLEDNKWRLMGDELL